MQKSPNEIDNFLTPDDTKIMKGIAIICMLLHHLWFFPNRIPGGGVEGIFTLFNAPATSYLGIFGKICVPMFFFFGGYGVYKRTLGKKYDVVLRLKKLYFAYWKFSSQEQYCNDPFISTRFNNFVPRELLSNFLGFTSTYNREWWFLISYVFALISFPLIRAVIDRYSARINLFIIVIVSLLFAHIFPGLKTVTALGVLGHSHMYEKGNLVSRPPEHLDVAYPSVLLLLFRCPGKDCRGSALCDSVAVGAYRDDVHRIGTFGLFLEGCWFCFSEGECRED